MAGTIVADTIQDGAGNSTSMDNAIYGSAKAWVNFNGTTTATIRASYNVSSVTRTGTGQYTISFTNAMTDANYSIVGLTDSQSGDTTNAVVQINTQSVNPSTSSFQIYTVLGNQSVVDRTYVCLSIFR